MSEPKVVYDLRKLESDAQIILAEDVTVLAAEDIDDMTGYAGATEGAGAVLTNAGGGGTTGLTAIAARIEHPRNVRIVQVVAGLTAGFLRVIGIGMDGLPTNELFSLLAASGAQVGNVPFLRIDEVHVWGVTGTLTTADHLSIGLGAKLGLPRSSNSTLFDVVKERHNQVDVAVTGTIDRAYGTYTPASAPGGDHVIELWYVLKHVTKW
jgi:hypothetical protein